VVVPPPVPDPVPPPPDALVPPEVEPPPPDPVEEPDEPPEEAEVPLEAGDEVAVEPPPVVVVAAAVVVVVFVEDFGGVTELAPPVVGTVSGGAPEVSAVGDVPPPHAASPAARRMLATVAIERLIGAGERRGPP
jgi:protein TonB